MHGGEEFGDIIVALVADGLGDGLLDPHLRRLEFDDRQGDAVGAEHDCKDGRVNCRNQHNFKRLCVFCSLIAKMDVWTFENHMGYVREHEFYVHIRQEAGMVRQIEISSMDLRYECCRVKSNYAEKLLMDSILLSR